MGNNYTLHISDQFNNKFLNYKLLAFLNIFFILLIVFFEQYKMNFMAIIHSLLLFAMYPIAYIINYYLIKYTQEKNYDEIVSFIKEVNTGQLVIYYPFSDDESVLKNLLIFIFTLLYFLVLNIVFTFLFSVIFWELISVFFFMIGTIEVAFFNKNQIVFYYFNQIKIKFSTILTVWKEKEIMGYKGIEKNLPYLFKSKIKGDKIIDKTIIQLVELYILPPLIFMLLFFISSILAFIYYWGFYYYVVFIIAGIYNLSLILIGINLIYRYKNNNENLNWIYNLIKEIEIELTGLNIFFKIFQRKSLENEAYKNG